MTLDQRGRIVSIESDPKVDSRYSTEFYSGILIPGMVNAHTHLELSYLKGALPEGAGFVEFAKGIGAVRGRYSKEQMVEAAQYQDALMWSSGVQAVGDICNSPITFEIKAKSKIEYHSFIELYGLKRKSAKKAIELREMAEQMGLSASITPHSTYSLNRELFSEAVEAEPTSPLSIHFMESPAEAELYRGEGELKEWYVATKMEHGFADDHSSPTHRIVENIGSERPLMLVHNTFIEEEEVELLRAKYGDNLTFVLCPSSNGYIMKVQPPTIMMGKKGVRVAIGTDSLASNHSLNMVEELRKLGDIPLEKALHWATLGGAEALGMSEEIGSIEVGKVPGVVLLSGVDMQQMKLRDGADTKRIV